MTDKPSPESLRNRIAAKKAEPAFQAFAKAMGAPVNLNAAWAVFYREAADICDEAGGKYAGRALNEHAAGAFDLMETFLRKANEAEYVATPCDPMVPCEDGGEPCQVHERLMAHAEGDHDLCEPDCGPAVPVSSPPPDQTANRDRIAEAVRETVTRIADLRSFDTQIADAVLAVLPPPADRAALDRQLVIEALYEARRPGLGSMTEAEAVAHMADAVLRRLAAEAQQPDTETRANGLPLVKGNCPACRQASLFLGTGGYPTCSNSECPEPDAATTVLEQYAHEAHPPAHAWRVETRDPGNAQWTPGSHFAHRPAAVERLDTANRTAPLWNDGTPVERRIVRETTTYTVEAERTPDTGHVCKPNARYYYCPRSGQVESDCHGGFSTCCDRPDLHEPVDTSEESGRV